MMPQGETLCTVKQKSNYWEEIVSPNTRSSRHTTNYRHKTSSSTTELRSSVTEHDLCKRPREQKDLKIFLSWDWVWERQMDRWGWKLWILELKMICSADRFIWGFSRISPKLALQYQVARTQAGSLDQKYTCYSNLKAVLPRRMNVSAGTVLLIFINKLGGWMLTRTKMRGQHVRLNILKQQPPPHKRAQIFAFPNGQIQT